MARKVSEKATAVYRKAGDLRQEQVLHDASRTEAAIAAAGDDCFTGIMDDWRARKLSEGTYYNRLQAYDAQVGGIIEDALRLGAHDWWESALLLWAKAADAEPSLMAAIALSPKNELKESSFVAGAFSMLLKIVDPPTHREVMSIINKPVNGETWRERLGQMTTRRVAPGAVAKAIANAYSAGGNVDDVKRALRPIVGTKGAAARTIARTESVRVANEMHERSMAQAGDALIGYTYEATLDDVVRPEHAARHGRVFKKDDPKRIQLPDGPNCRCHYSAIIAADVTVFGRPGSLPPEAKKVEEFANWYDKQSPHRREQIVGKERFKAAVEKYGVGDPSWEQVTSASPNLETLRVRGDLEKAARAARSQRRDQ